MDTLMSGNVTQNLNGNQMHWDVSGIKNHKVFGKDNIDNKLSKYTTQKTSRTQQMTVWPVMSKNQVFFTLFWVVYIGEERCWIWRMSEWVWFHAVFSNISTISGQQTYEKVGIEYGPSAWWANVLNH